MCMRGQKRRNSARINCDQYVPRHAVGSIAGFIKFYPTGCKRVVEKFVWLSISISIVSWTRVKLFLLTRMRPVISYAFAVATCVTLHMTTWLFHFSTWIIYSLYRNFWLTQFNTGQYLLLCFNSRSTHVLNSFWNLSPMYEASHRMLYSRSLSRIFRQCMRNKHIFAWQLFRQSSLI